LREFFSEGRLFLIPEDPSQIELLLSASFNASTLGFCILDTEFRYLAVNEALARMNGLTPEEHLGHTVRQLLGAFADQIEPELRLVLATGQPRLDIHVSGVLPKKNETGYWISHFFAITYSNGMVTRIGAIALEVTQQKQMEAEVTHLNQGMKLQMDRLQMLLDVGGLLAANWNAAQVFPKVSARIRRVLRHEYAGFSLHDADRGMLVRQAEDFPLGKGLTNEVQISSSNSPGARSLEARAPLIFSKEQMQACDAEIAQRFLDEGLQSLCCVPLLRPQGPLGVLVLGSTRPNAFQQEDLSLLNQVAAQLGIALENSRAAAEIELLKQRLNEERKYLEEEGRTQGEFGEIIGESPALKKVLEQVATVADSDATVLILGETGTGKELIAHAIHRMSRRKDRNFVKVNCAAIPTGLLESELFGHEKGAFTGAVSQKMGRMELADAGTVFLDEVGEIPLELQPKLLRVLQDQEFERLGSTRTIRVNLRIIAATNRDLARSVVEHQFRNDLFYRLNVFPIRVPPLRERREDISLLVRYFVKKFARRMDRHIESIPTESMAALKRWSWPGNVRELENLMERSVILSFGPALHIPISELQSAASGEDREVDETLSGAEREHIVHVLHETGGVLSGANGAAQRLGLKRTTLQSKIRRLGITRQEYMGPSGKES
jgi:formate hydrogenlyase transcriptional activator